MNTLQSIVEQLNADYKQKVDAARAEYDAKRHELKEAKKAAIQAAMSAVEPANPSPDKKHKKAAYSIQRVIKGSAQGWLKDSELFDAEGVMCEFGTPDDYRYYTDKHGNDLRGCYIFVTAIPRKRKLDDTPR